MTPIVFEAKPVARFAGLRVWTTLEGTGFLIPRARALALGYTVSPASRACVSGQRWRVLGS